MNKGVELDGVVYADNGEGLDVNEFLDEFLLFVKSKGWYYGGLTRQVDENGDPIKP